jgi:cytochrome d ubiquinol oxidase subunit I
MLFGRKRVSERMHTIATALVAAGTTLSAFWILALNSWMQTPTGFEMIDGQAHATSWAAIVFNPSFPYRLTHMLIASGLTCAFLVAGLSAYRRLRGDDSGEVRASLRTAVFLAALLIPVQIVVGDLHGLNTLEHQPAKVAAMEGIWRTERGAALRLFALPDEDSRSNRYELAIPNLASLILTHELDGEVRGLDDFDDHPPVAPVFWAFRVMIGVGLLMLALSWLAAWQLRRRDRTPSRWLLRALVAMSFSGWIATLAGWYVTEIGRQPWLVYGVLRTADAASNVPAPLIATSLAMYLSIYVALLLAYIWVLFHLMRKASAGDKRMPPTPAAIRELT